MNQLELIKSNLINNKINTAQIDPFSHCNNKCWYCPVRYYSQPLNPVHMAPELFEKIIINLIEERGNLVTENFNFIYMGHYNEIFLYRYFKEMLQIMCKHGFRTIILSNGLLMDRNKTDLMNEYSEAIYGICLNIPAINPGLWANWTGNLPNSNQKLINNVLYAGEQLKDKLQLSIQVNSYGDKIPAAMEQSKKMKALFPDWNIYEAFGLVDRAGLLIPYGIKNKLETGEVFNFCTNGNRPYEWLHVNCWGEAFLCCDDFFMSVKFGDLNSQSINDFWLSEEHILAINNGIEICRKCVHARYL